MAYDSLVLSALINELNQTILGARIEKIYQPGKTDIVIIFHTPAGKQRLFMSADPGMARVHLTRFNRENPLTPPMFCMVLRKHLEGGKLTRISQPDFERIIRLHIESYDELGRLSEKILVCEIMGKHSNIILLNSEDNVILDGIIRFSHAVNRYREVLPGRSYIAPPGQGKINPLHISEYDFKSILWKKVLTCAESAPASPDKWLLQTFTGLSPQTCREMFLLSGLAEDITLDNFGEHELQKLWEAFSSMMEKTKKAAFCPTLVLDNNKQPVAFSAYDLVQFGPLPKLHGSMNEITDRFYQARYEQNLFRQLRDRLNKTVSNEISRNRKKLTFQEETIALAKAAEEYRKAGELLMANLHLLKPYMESVTLPDFYDPGQKEITIALDPSLTPSENAQAYFKKYNKAKAGKKAARELQREIEQELAYLESVSANIDQAASLEDLAEIKTELAEQGYIREKSTGKNKKTPAPESRPWQFSTEEGTIIWVGKNNKQNDWLTCKKAKASDIWLHVKDSPGSHVIVRSENGDIPEKVLIQAALLAAYFSKARNSAKVPVDYTLRKYVHKPNGAKPGMVIYENQRTVYVTPPRELSEIPVRQIIE